MIDKRAIRITEKVLNYHKISIIELEETLELSQRQIEYSLHKMNSWFMSKTKNKVKIDYDPVNKKYEISESAREKIVVLLNQISRKEYIFDNEEREFSIFLILLIDLEHISLNHFIQYFQVSRSTILKDIENVNIKFSKYEIEVSYDRVNGFHLFGTEENIRYVMLKMVLEVLAANNDKVIDFIIEFFIISEKKDVSRIIYKNELKYDMQFSENRLKDIIYTTIFLSERMKKNSYNKIEKLVDIRRLSGTKEYCFSESVMKLLGNSRRGEIDYYAAWILGNTTGVFVDDSVDKEEVIDLIIQIIIRLESVLGIRLSNRENTIKLLYNHIRPAYYRLLYKLPVVNPFSPKIKKNYEEIFNLIRMAVEPYLSMFDSIFLEEEIAFLTMYFAPLIRNNKDIKMSIDNSVQKKALVVCSNGVGTSSILLFELQKIFPEVQFLSPVEYEAVDNLKENYDIIFTTTMKSSLFIKKQPCFLVSPIMSSQEKSSLLQSVGRHLGQTTLGHLDIDDIMRIISKYSVISNDIDLKKDLLDYLIKPQKIKEMEGGPLLSMIINPRLIQIGIKVDTWEGAIRQAAIPLVTEDIVEERYVQAMIETTKELGPYIVITKHVALPHARPECGVKKVGISIATLETPVEFGNKGNDPVKYIFCLSAVDNTTHLNAISELVELLENPIFYEKLDTSTSPQEIYDYIIEFEKERGLL